MATITIHSAVMNAAALLPKGKHRRILDRVSQILDYRVPVRDEAGDVGARVIEFEEDESATEIGAICPYCGREPVPIQCNPVQFGPVPALQFTCSGCRKILSIAIIPPPPMMMQPEQNPSGIVRPF